MSRLRHLLLLFWILALSPVPGCGIPAQSAGDFDTLIVASQPHGPGPRVLCVLAHPDDETVFAATLYKTRTLLDGRCDIVLITNGEGGFKYSSPAEPVYGLELTDEAVGRRHLPVIREKEFLAGCRWMGIRRAYLFRETDHRYTPDPLEVLGPQARVWNLDRVRRGLARLLSEETYDFVLTHLPDPTTHGHHQAATILALEAARQIPESRRPVILGARAEDSGALRPPSPGLPLFPDTQIDPDREPFVFDRRQPFGYQGRLNYQIVVNWVIAEHKSQGTMQLAMNRQDVERFWLYRLNAPGSMEKAAKWFADLHRPQYLGKTYGPSAGAPRPAP